MNARAFSLLLFCLSLALPSPGWTECLQGNCDNGNGIYQWPDGSRYEGGFKDNKFHGHGTYQWADGKKYVGEFSNDKRNGFGTYSWPNGSRYKGGWKDGTRHGNGTFTWANGSKYEGEWYDGQKRGLGIYTFPDGSREAGRWVAGEIIEPMDPEVVAIQLAGSAMAASPASPPVRQAEAEPAPAPAPPLPAKPEQSQVRTDTAATATSVPLPPKETPPADKPMPAPRAQVPLPAAFSLAVHKIPLVRGGKAVDNKGIPLYPRGRSRQVGTCRVSVAKAGSDKEISVDVSVENLTDCRMSMEAYLRQDKTYLKLVSWSGDEAIGPKGKKSAKETVVLPSPLFSDGLLLKAQGDFRNCP